MNNSEIDEISISLVREFLSSKGLQKTLQCLENENPRHQFSINKRSLLIKLLHLEKLAKRNKEQIVPLQTIIELIVKHLYDKASTSKTEEDCVQQIHKSRSNVSHFTIQKGGQIPKTLSNFIPIDQTLDSNLQSSKISALNSLTPTGINDLDSSCSQTTEVTTLTEFGDIASKLKNFQHLNSQFESSKDDFLENSNKDSRINSKPPFYSSKTNSLTKKSSQSLRSAMTLSNACGDIVIDDLDEFEVNESGLLHDSRKSILPGRLKSGINISHNQHQELKILLFGSSNGKFNVEWKMQNIEFYDHPDLKYGLAQKKGGPCGVLASLQSYVLKELLFPETGRPIGLNPVFDEQRMVLKKAICQILWKIGQQKQAVVVISQSTASDVRHCTDGLIFFPCSSFKELEDCIEVYLHLFQKSTPDSSGCILLIYSAIFTRGIPNIKKDMDDPEGRLMGAHGYCTQEIVNLLLTGKATSNVFDNIIELDTGGNEKSILKGITSPCEMGYLSLFEHYNSCKVGNYFKNPFYPIWIIYSESHFTVLFSVEKNLLNEKLTTFDLYYYDGLAHQDAEIKLTVELSEANMNAILVSDSDDGPPLEHCIRTKWPEAKISWNGYEPLL